MPLRKATNREKAEAIYGSPDVFKYLADAESIAEGYGINVVTSVAVAGKYIVDIKMSGTTKPWTLWLSMSARRAPDVHKSRFYILRAGAWRYNNALPRLWEFQT